MAKKHATCKHCWAPVDVEIPCSIKQLREMKAEIKSLRSLLEGLYKKLPHTTRDLSSGRCVGCGAIHWCGDGKEKDPCKDDCIIQKAKRKLEEQK
jgi:hypothetical protein